MNKSSSIGAIDKTDLSEQTKKNKSISVRWNKWNWKLPYRRNWSKKNHAVKNYVNMLQL